LIDSWLQAKDVNLKNTKCIHLTDDFKAINVTHCGKVKKESEYPHILILVKEIPCLRQTISIFFYWRNLGNLFWPRVEGTANMLNDLK